MATGASITAHNVQPVEYRFGDGPNDVRTPRGANPMRAITLSITAAVLLALAAPAEAQQPVPVYDPGVGAYVVAPNLYTFAPSPNGPRVWGPGGYYSYQPYVYNTARPYAYSSFGYPPAYGYYPDYNTYTYTYRRFYRYGQ